MTKPKPPRLRPVKHYRRCVRRKACGNCKYFILDWENAEAHCARPMRRCAGPRPRFPLDYRHSLPDVLAQAFEHVCDRWAKKDN